MTRVAGGSSRGGSGGYNPVMRQARWVRAGLVAVGGLLLAGGLAYVALVPPDAVSVYPKCQLHQLTGLHCPGCGLTRSAHSLLNGRPGQAVAYNVLVPVLLAWLAVEAARRGRAWYRGRPDPGWWLRAEWAPWLLAGLGVFAVLRNLPVWPLILLAPHEIG